MTHREGGMPSKRVIVAFVVVFTLLSKTHVSQAPVTGGIVQATRPISGHIVVERAAAQRPPAAAAVLPARSADTLPSQISDAEFWQMIVEFSEPEGKFPYDNFISNEMTQQVVIPALTRAARPGEVYIGVGPEQNFTYASALKARMAFVIDIRRQNMLELLLYKALFELSPDRADFVSRLFSRKRPAGLDEKTSAIALFAAYEKAAPDGDLFLENRQAIAGIFKKHGFEISSDDTLGIERVYQAFYRGGPSMNSNSGPGPASGTPSYIDLMSIPDAAGTNWSYLATEENYRRIREMHQKNLFVPLVGDFSGSRTIRNIARYLKEHNANVSAFYASNVETYLNESQTRDFYGNLLALPSDSTTMVIRFVDNRHRMELPSWAIGGIYLQVVSPMSDLTRLASGGNTPKLPDLLRLINDPAPGSIIPGFILPMSQTGRRFSIALEPRSDGFFRAFLPSPTEPLQVGAPINLPAGYAFKSITWGSKNLTNEPLTPTDLDNTANELVITLSTQ